MNLYIPCWISCKTNAFMRYFRHMTIQMIPPKMKIMENVVGNIQINLVFFLMTTPYMCETNLVQTSPR